ncbi:Ger(x)C family spore germination protein [Bacillus timonensis]|uniref:Ger(x)C family spore germination protein n=1 Tax=Bacillus timonensis TaxID=1033734 RepID=UPI000287B7ED|nr:Ger(x)C family spore germination protein [Bacillus timonensis]
MNKVILFVMLFLSMLLLTSCWSKKELTDIAIVSALGVDLDGDGRYVGTIQVVNPGNVAGGQQGGGNNSYGPPVNVYSETGNNLVEISKKFSTKISRRLYYAHTNLVVVGERLAREEGILHILDAMDRDPEFRITSVVVIAQDTAAKDLLRTLTPIDKLPSNKVIKTLKSTEKNWGSHLEVNMKDVINDLVSEGKEPLITGFGVRGEINQAMKLENLQETTPEAILQAEGIAVFKDGKLVDWLQDDTARGSLWILDKIQETDLNIDWEGKVDAIAYEVIRQNTKVSSTTQQGKPMINVEVQAEGEIGEVEVPIDLTNPHLLLRIETEIEKEIKKEIQEAIKQIQANKSDVFGFGEVVHQSDPKLWKKIKADWNDVYFPDLQVDVKVNSFVRRSGLRSKSFLSEMKENR